MPTTTSPEESDLREPDGGPAVRRARRRATVRAVAVPVLVAAVAYTLIEVVSSLAGWHPGYWGLVAVYAGYLGTDRLVSRRRARRVSPPAGPDAPGR